MRRRRHVDLEGAGVMGASVAVEVAKPTLVGVVNIFGGVLSGSCWS
jgi:hypothetical protein